MDNHEFKKEIHDLLSIRMTAEEKRAMLANIFNAPLISSPALVKSPWSVYSFNIWITRNKIFSSVIAALLVVILGGGGLSYAAGKALPGDPLYGFKVNVSEPLRAALTPTLAARAQVQAELATTRLTEAEALAAEGKLNASNEKELTGLLAEHTAALNDTLSQVKLASPAEAQDIQVGFQASMDAHAQVLDTIAASAPSNSAAGSQPGFAASATAVTIVSAASSSPTIASLNIAAAARSEAASVAVVHVQNNGNDSNSRTTQNRGRDRGNRRVSKTTQTSTVTTTATAALTASISSSSSAAAVAVTPTPLPVVTPVLPAIVSSSSISSSTTTASTTSQADNADSGDSSFNMRKQSIQSLIQSASGTINAVGTDTTPVQQNIIDQTQNTLNQARQSLDQAEQQNSSGNNDDAASSLLQSQKAAQQANIFLDAGLKWGRNRGHGNGGN
jgi:hypothetical protein